MTAKGNVQTITENGSEPPKSRAEQAEELLKRLVRAAENATQVIDRLLALIDEQRALNAAKANDTTDETVA